MLAILCEIGVLVTIGAASANAQKVEPPSAQELMAITARGILLNEYDQAAWHAQTPCKRPIRKQSKASAGLQKRKTKMDGSLRKAQRGQECF